jgi:hypothetical protein
MSEFEEALDAELEKVFEASMDAQSVPIAARASLRSHFFETCKHQIASKLVQLVLK